MTVNSIGNSSVHSSDYCVKSGVITGEYIIMIMHSRGIFIIEGKNYFAEPGDIILFDGSCERNYSADGEPFVFDWVSFSPDGSSDLPELADIPKSKIIRFCDADFLSSITENLVKEFYSLYARRGKMIDFLLRMMFIKISETVSPVSQSVHDNSDIHYSVLNELRDKIYRNPQLKWNVDSMAAEVNMSRSYFQHIYRETFGISCISDVIGSKIEKAKELLSGTDCTVAQVAAMCGYDNEEHFMRQFKKNVGITPTTYRKKLIS
ncbi:MAG: AraC family transcriptional regulator [Oscillospiraceae bacterium]|nr:AraC family transcriptional regulator [Oscillospiraceae bacterium]